MKTMRLPNLSDITTFVALTLISTQLIANQPLLRWSGSTNNSWDNYSLNWIDSNESPSAWLPGAVAEFDATGGIINVSEGIEVDSIIFTTSGYNLLGSGWLTIASTISCAADTYAAIAAPVVAPLSLTKTGTGSLALNECRGTLLVSDGTLVAASSLLKNLNIEVADGATLMTLGTADPSANLVTNGGFEDPQLSDGAWAYRDITGWERTEYSQYLGLKNTAASGEWTVEGNSPEGDQMAIVQGGAVLSQTVTVPQDGLYSLSFYYVLRNQTPARTNLVNVSLNGHTLAQFINETRCTVPEQFASLPLYLKSGNYTLAFTGSKDHGWGDHTTLIDAVCLATPADAQPCLALGGRTLITLDAQSSVALNHTGDLAATLIALDGTSNQQGESFSVSHSSGIFSGNGTLTSLSQENLLLQSNGGNWSIASNWANLAAPQGSGTEQLMLGSNAANDIAANLPLGSLHLAQASSATLSGEPITVYDSISQAPGSTWTISTPVFAATKMLKIINDGDLTLTDKLNVNTNGLLVKLGLGNLNLQATSNLFSMAYIYEGNITVPRLLDGSEHIYIYSQPNTTASITLTEPAVYSRRINFYGNGMPTLHVDANGLVNMGNLHHLHAYGSSAILDIASGSAFSFMQLLRNVGDNGMTSNPILLKTGGGTLEIRNGGHNNSNYRAYSGGTILRDGTIVLSEDDWGTKDSDWTNPFNGRVNLSTGGSLGYSPFNEAVIVGDAFTPPAANLAIIANGNMRYIGHDIEFFNYGASSTLAITEGSAMYDGNLILHRPITLTGAISANMFINTVTLAPDYTGDSTYLTLDGLASLDVTGSLPADTDLAMKSRTLSFNRGSVKKQTLKTLSLGTETTSGGLLVDFGGSANDEITVTATDGLELNKVLVTLYYAGADLPFAEQGTYTLFNYSGDLQGTFDLSIGNPIPGASYTFNNDTANQRITLTISGSPAGISTIWVNPVGANWGTSSNWSANSVPNAANLMPLLGAAITENSLIELTSNYTVGGLQFNNPFKYTLGGSGKLTLDNGAISPQIKLLNGTHAIDTIVESSKAIEVQSAANNQLLLTGNSQIAAPLTLLSGSTLAMQGSAEITGTLDLASTSTLLVNDNATATINGLTGADSASISLQGSTAQLEVNQNHDTYFDGKLKGSQGTALVKSGTGNLTLSARQHDFSGTLKAQAGTLSLNASRLAGAAQVATAATLSIPAPIVNGLMGYYYSQTPNTNNYWTLAAMESYFATQTPDLIASSGTVGEYFDFGVGSTYNFPAPYNNDGARSINFQAVWRGSILLDETGSYAFGVNCDDGFILAINGKTILQRNFYSSSWYNANLFLEAGRHDIVLGYFQQTGGAGIKLRMRKPSTGANMSGELIPNSILSPYSAASTINGSGTFELPSAASAFTTTTGMGFHDWLGSFTTAQGSLFTKADAGVLRIATGSSNNPIQGRIELIDGALDLVGNNQLNPAAHIGMQADTALMISGVESLAAIHGKGYVALGSAVYLIPFTDDSDCGISTAKTYTHLYDFPTSLHRATVNGVAFNNTGAMSGSVPNGVWDSSPGSASYTGIDSLLYDFSYGSDVFTLTLSGLESGVSHDFRLYFRNFAGNTRNLILTFTVEDKVIDVVAYNPDTITRSIMGCRYVAGNSGKMSVKIQSLDSGNRCHLYALTNEKLGTPATQLTLTTPDQSDYSFTGSLSGMGALIKSGNGTQTLRGTIDLDQPLALQAGTITLLPQTTVANPVAIAPAATLNVPDGATTLTTLTGTGTLQLGYPGSNASFTEPYFFEFDSDATCGISPDKVYTHAIDFGDGSGAPVNGVAFTKTISSSGTVNGYGWENMPKSTHGGSEINNIGISEENGIYYLLRDMNYNLNSGETMKLTGLDPTKWYEIRLYSRCWDPLKNRTSTLTFDPDGDGPISHSITYNFDTANKPPNYLGYRYQPLNGELAITVTRSVGDSHHLYGLTNEEITDQAHSPTTIAIDDECIFDGTITGNGALLKNGTGNFAVTALNAGMDGPLTVAAGSCGTLAGARLTSGPATVLAGATLYGAGQSAGSTLVKTGGAILGGVPGAVGTLQLLGDLVLEEDAITKFTFLNNQGSSIVATGNVTLPTSATLTATALIPGSKPPGRSVLFASLTGPIDGPEDFAEWTVNGASTARIIYNQDKTAALLYYPRSTILLIR